MGKKHLIIGSGSAGLSALEEIRRINQEDEIKMVTMENCLPYSPTSLPYLLAERTKEKDLWARDEAYFKDTNVIFSTGKRVIKIVPGEKRIVYHDGESESYDQLLVASGSKPIKPRIEGLNGHGVMSFHTLNDYHEIVGLLGSGSRVGILGAGLVGVEIAAALSERGCSVKVLEKEDEVLPFTFDKPVTDYISDVLSRNSIDIHTSKEVAEIKRKSNGLEIVCADGDGFYIDLVISCVGVASRISMLEDSGIKTEKGIMVDKRMRTNIEGIYAAGDVAESEDFFNIQTGVNAIIPTAVSQGKIAGANMAGKEVLYKGWIPMNMFNFFGNLVGSIGLSRQQGSREVMEKLGSKRRSFRRFVFDGDRLIGVMFMNEALDPGVIRYLIEERTPIGSYKDLLFEKPKETSRWLMLKREEEQSKYNT
ncbi:MAG: NAD(P)/FAD-dependent oxidoreductase [Desulfatiglans sp.]|nr:NAD(P)/FAD-dependent oxidoreductase [Desulfatiglans sp.]